MFNCLFKYYGIPRSFKCSLFSKEVKMVVPGAINQPILTKQKRILSDASEKENLPTSKRNSKKGLKKTITIESDDDDDETFIFHNTQKSQISSNNSSNINNSTAGIFNSTANSSNSTADSSNSTADSSNSTADSSNSTADSSNSTADSSNSTADSSNSTADRSNSTASSSNSTSSSSNSTAGSSDSTEEDEKNELPPELTIVELDKLARNDEFPQKIFLINKKRVYITPVAHMYTSTNRIFAEKPTEAIEWTCKLNKTHHINCKFGELTNLNHHLLLHKESAWYKKYTAHKGQKKTKLLTEGQL